MHSTNSVTCMVCDAVTEVVRAALTRHISSFTFPCIRVCDVWRTYLFVREARRSRQLTTSFRVREGRHGFLAASTRKVGKMSPKYDTLAKKPHFRRPSANLREASAITKSSRRLFRAMRSIKNAKPPRPPRDRRIQKKEGYEVGSRRFGAQQHSIMG